MKNPDTRTLIAVALLGFGVGLLSDNPFWIDLPAILLMAAAFHWATYAYEERGRIEGIKQIEAALRSRRGIGGAP